MLVLSRKQSESIRIGDDVVVKVIRTGKGSVKIGIEAPREVRVVRGELGGPRAAKPTVAGDDEDGETEGGRELSASARTHAALPQAV
ncbi:MAG: carbon storage regulator [Planctomycetota bacterium]